MKRRTDCGSCESMRDHECVEYMPHDQATTKEAIEAKRLQREAEKTARKRAKQAEDDAKRELKAREVEERKRKRGEEKQEKMREIWFKSIRVTGYRYVVPATAIPPAQG